VCVSSGVFCRETSKRRLKLSLVLNTLPPSFPPFLLPSRPPPDPPPRYDIFWYFCEVSPRETFRDATIHWRTGEPGDVRIDSIYGFQQDVARLKGAPLLIAALRHAGGSTTFHKALIETTEAWPPFCWTSPGRIGSNCLGGLSRTVRTWPYRKWNNELVPLRMHLRFRLNLPPFVCTALLAYVILVMCTNVSIVESLTHTRVDMRRSTI
jgi:hypothetical protein